MGSWGKDGGGGGKIAPDASVIRGGLKGAIARARKHRQKTVPVTLPGRSAEEEPPPPAPRPPRGPSGKWGRP